MRKQFRRRDTMQYGSRNSMFIFTEKWWDEINQGVSAFEICIKYFCLKSGAMMVEELKADRQLSWFFLVIWCLIFWLCAWMQEHALSFLPQILSSQILLWKSLLCLLPTSRPALCSYFSMIVARTLFAPPRSSSWWRLSASSGSIVIMLHISDN